MFEIFVAKNGDAYICQVRPDGNLRCGKCFRGVLKPDRWVCRVCGAILVLEPLLKREKFYMVTPVEAKGCLN